MEIENKVARSGLITFEMKSLRSKAEMVHLDIAPWLYEELILKEKDFRNYIADHNWSQYEGKRLRIFCSVDAIIPSWAYMLLADKAAPFVVFCFVGEEQEMRQFELLHAIQNLDVAPFESGRVIVNGCSDPDVSPAAFAMLTAKLRPVVKSILFGEACSTVPVYKAPKN
ncbi:MAG: DUF2480 family protein [Schleiferiaceae bacterium]|nr:DUF2480 family protein [Schleiferiaceae bacterium]